ncbi:MAG: M16 family metallopeptidase [Pseudonocardia sp.]
MTARDTGATRHRSAAEIGRTPTGPRPLPALGATREVPLPDVEQTVLATGLRVLAARNPGVPMVEVRLRVPFAAPDHPAPDHPAPDHAAVAELLSSTLLTGTATRDRVTIDDQLAAVGAELGVSVDPERLALGGSGLADGLPTVLEVLADVLTAAAYPDADVGRERDRLVERIAVARAQPSTIAREALQRRRFGDHPITRELPTGGEVAAVTTEQLRALHAAAVLPGGSILTLVGDLDPAAAIGLVEKLLAGWDVPGAARELAAPPVLTPGELLLVHRPGSVQSQLRLTAPALGRHDPRYAALQLANLVFGGYFSSRWMENIREDKGYTYGAHSGIEFVPGGGVLGVETDVASDVTAAALLETRYELGRLTAVPPTAAEVDAARRYAVGSLLISLDSQGGFASTVAALAADGLDVEWLRAHPARLESVTVDEVAAAALDFFAPTAFTGVVVGDADVTGPGVRALGGVTGP